MTGILRELHRVLKPGGHIAFEVGEVRNGKVKLEEVHDQQGPAVECHAVAWTGQRPFHAVAESVAKIRTHRALRRIKAFG